MSTRDWQALKDHFDDNIYYPADLTWHGLTVRNIGIRSRGGATRNPLKPGLRVDINHYVTDQQFLGLKAFALDNMYSDTSLVRETVTMKMFAKMDLPASRESHVRLYVNNEYVGAYVIIEAVDRTFIDRTFGSAGGKRRTRWLPVRIPMDFTLPVRISGAVARSLRGPVQTADARH